MHVDLRADVDLEDVIRLDPRRVQEVVGYVPTYVRVDDFDRERAAQGDACRMALSSPSAPLIVDRLMMLTIV